MESKEIIFDEHLEMYVDLNLKGSDTEVCIVLSDSLYASEEKLTEDYKTRISNFINKLPEWYDIAVNAVIQRAKEKYDINTKKDDIELMSIFILFEQNEEELFGLSFRVEFDIEHGCGLKIKGDDYRITEIGTGDIAFC